MGGFKIFTTISVFIFLSLQFIYAETQDSLHNIIESDDILLPSEEGLQPDTSTPDSAFLARSADSSWWIRKIENLAFGLNEYLEYSINYGMLPAGNAKMFIPELIEYNGVKCYRVVSIASSNDFVSMFYKVRDTIETYIDVDGIFTHYFHKLLQEGGYKANKTTIFNQRLHLAITGKDTIPTYPFVQDALSSLYYIRTQKIEPGVDIMIDNHTDGKNYPLKVIVHGRERVKVPAGEFDCIVVEPVMRYEGIFKAKGAIRIWLTDDEFKVPVKMQTEVFFLGSIIAKLKKFERGILLEELKISDEDASKE